MIETSEFKKGVCIVYREAPMMIVDVTFASPTARGATTIVKTRLRNLLTGQLYSESIRSGERFPEVDLERRPCSFLYGDGSRWYFMDQQTFEQFDLDAEALGDAIYYLVDGVEGVSCVVIDGRIVSIQLPTAVSLRVVETDPAIKGATVTAVMKPAKTETGLVVQVPPYLGPGEVIRVDTRDARFIERAK
jgi:elongation factor P